MCECAVYSQMTVETKREEPPSDHWFPTYPKSFDKWGGGAIIPCIYTCKINGGKLDYVYQIMKQYKKRVAITEEM